MPDYAVHTTFTAKDQVSASFKRMSEAAGKFQSKTSSAFRNATKEGYKFQTVMKGIIAANLIRGAVSGVTNSVQTASSTFLEFDDIIYGAVSRFDDVGPQAANFLDMVKTVGQQARKSIQGTRFSAVDAASTLNELAKAGYKVNAAMNIMPSMMDMATVAQENLADATTMSSDILGAFGLRSNNVQKQLENHKRLNDMLTKSGLLSTGGLRDLYETLQQTAPLSQELGMLPEQVLAFSTVLTNAGIKGSEAATALKRGWLNIFTGKMADEFKANGIAVADQNGKLLDFSVILGTIGKKLEPLTQAQKIPILEKIFGVYGLAGNLKLLRSLEEIADVQQKIADSDGISRLGAEKQNMSLLAKGTILVNSGLDKIYTTFEKFKPGIGAGLDKMIVAVNNWKPDSLIRGLTAAGTILQTLWRILQPFVPLLPYIATYFFVFGTAVKLLSLGQTVFMLFRMGKAMYFALGAAKTLSLLFATSPIGLIATGIALAVVAIIALEKKFGIFSTAWEYWSNKLKQFWTWFQTTTFFKIAEGIGKAGVGFGKALMGMEIPGLEQFGKQSETPAPNKKEAEARQIQFTGNLNINGAPAGTTFDQKTKGAPPLSYAMLGVNP